MTQRFVGLTPEEELKAMRTAKVLRKKPPPDKKKLNRPSKSVRAKLREELQAMMKSGEWKQAQPRHFVELTAWMHESTYGVEEAELVGPGPSWMGAVSRVKHVLREDFAGDLTALASYVRWVWAREQDREAWRRKNGQETRFRVSWRVAFGPSFLTDHRVQHPRG